MDPKQSFYCPELTYVNPAIDVGGSDILSAGCDIGSTSSQMVILIDGELYAYASMRSKGKSDQSALAILERLLNETGLILGDIDYTVGTGYGRVQIPFAQRQITEISCHARGGNYLYGSSVKSILDMGGQDLKLIWCDEKGKVQNFVMNDKCAAGAGRGIETMAELLSVPIEEAGRIAADYEGELPNISPVCVVFAKTDALRALKSGWSKASILAAYCNATARQVYEFMSTLGVKRDFCITGGIAKNKGVVRALEKLIGITALRPNFDTQIVGAVGAALYARALVMREKGLTTYS
jgi:bzd-type benzoyl-CoA reductase Q subunit